MKFALEDRELEAEIPLQDKPQTCVAQRSGAYFFQVSLPSFECVGPGHKMKQLKVASPMSSNFFQK